MSIIFKELEEQLIIHNQYCEKIMAERFKSEKYDGEWKNSIFHKYEISKTKLDLLIKLYKKEKYSN